MERGRGYVPDFHLPKEYIFNNLIGIHVLALTNISHNKANKCTDVKNYIFTQNFP
jgi:hypothetical protein